MGTAVYHLGDCVYLTEACPLECEETHSRARERQLSSERSGM